MWRFNVYPIRFMFVYYLYGANALRWRHTSVMTSQINGNYLLTPFHGLTSKEKQICPSLSLCEGNSPVTGGFTPQNYMDAKSVSLPWLHQDRKCKQSWWRLKARCLQSDRACETTVNDLMMTSSNGNDFRVTGPLCGEFTGHRWIHQTKASDTVLWCFLWSSPEQTVK